MAKLNIARRVAVKPVARRITRSVMDDTNPYTSDIDDGGTTPIDEGGATPGSVYDNSAPGTPLQLAPNERQQPVPDVPPYSPAGSLEDSESAELVPYEESFSDADMMTLPGEEEERDPQSPSTIENDGHSPTDEDGPEGDMQSDDGGGQLDMIAEDPDKFSMTCKDGRENEVDDITSNKNLANRISKAQQASSYQEPLLHNYNADSGFQTQQIPSKAQERPLDYYDSDKASGAKQIPTKGQGRPLGKRNADKKRIQSRDANIPCITLTASPESIAANRLSAPSWGDRNPPSWKDRAPPSLRPRAPVRTRSIHNTVHQAAWERESAEKLLKTVKCEDDPLNPPVLKGHTLPEALQQIPALFPRCLPQAMADHLSDLRNKYGQLELHTALHNCTDEQMAPVQAVADPELRTMLSAHTKNYGEEESEIKQAHSRDFFPFHRYKKKPYAIDQIRRISVSPTGGETLLFHVPRAIPDSSVLYDVEAVWHSYTLDGPDCIGRFSRVYDAVFGLSGLWVARLNSKKRLEVEYRDHDGTRCLEEVPVQGLSRWHHVNLTVESDDTATLRCLIGDQIIPWSLELTPSREGLTKMTLTCEERPQARWKNSDEALLYSDDFRVSFDNESGMISIQGDTEPVGEVQFDPRAEAAAPVALWGSPGGDLVVFFHGKRCVWWERGPGHHWIRAAIPEIEGRQILNAQVAPDMKHIAICYNTGHVAFYGLSVRQEIIQSRELKLMYEVELGASNPVRTLAWFGKSDYLWAAKDDIVFLLHRFPQQPDELKELRARLENAGKGRGWEIRNPNIE